MWGRLAACAAVGYRRRSAAAFQAVAVPSPQLANNVLWIQWQEHQRRSLVFFGIRGIVCRLSLFACCLFGAMAQAQVNVTTYHNDNARDGQNLSESILTPANVNANQFGQLFAQPVDGYVYAQPLYVSTLQIAGGAHNVVFVATEHDSVYAFDADGNTGADANPLWHASFINPAAGITTVNSASDLNCGNIQPEVGITGTPVVDLTSNTLYVVAKTKENGAFFQRLHALDITSGAEKFGGPIVVQATVPGMGAGTANGQIAFDALRENQRAALLLLNGLVYVSWASHCDTAPFHGWLIAYNAQSLQVAAVWNSTPNGSDGGVWQSGSGPAADSSGDIFLATANGTFDLNNEGPDTGDSVLKFGPLSGANFQVLDYFTPYNQNHLAVTDTDLGSGGVVLLPDQPAGSPHRHLLAEMGKQGSLYLVNRDSMGHFDGAGDTQIVQWLPNLTGGLWATPAFWNNTLYVGGTNDALQAFSFNANNSGLFSTSPVSSSPETYSYPGPTPSISANGNTNAILWALEADQSPAVLHAYDATNLANELFNTGNNPQQAPGPPVNFSVPTIANGKVYAGTATQLAVYGLLGPPPAAPALVSPGNQLTGVGPQPTLTWSAASGATSYDVYIGTSSPPPMVANVSATSYSRTVCGSNTVCYWMIVARNEGGTAASQTWSFTTGNFPAQIASPAPGIALSGSLATFAWTAVTGATQYQLTVGTTPGGSNVFNGSISGISQTVAKIPCNGGTVFVQLTAEVNGSYLPAAGYTYACKPGLGDFNGDGYQDVLWQNNSTHQVTVQYYDGTQGLTFLNWNWLNSAGEPNGWVLVGAADFDGNGVPDLVWEYMPTGQVTVNYYGGPGGATLLGWNWLNEHGDPGWTVAAVADMNNDGVPDLIWQNNTTNQVTVNYYGGTGGATLTGWNWLNSAGEPAGWRVVAAADFDRNGTPDLVWEYTPTRQVTVNYYGGTGGAAYLGWNWLNVAGNPGWTVVGANDFNGDGVPDLVWQNDATAQVSVSYYGGTGGATSIGANWLAASGYLGWTAVVPR
jgi:hypothetical protein